MTEISAVINKEVFKKKKKDSLINRRGKGLESTTDRNILKLY